MRRVGCVITAAGASARFGENKLLAPFLGKPLLLHTLETVRSLPLARVAVVSPYPAVHEMARAMGFLPVAPEGPSRDDTVRAGIRAMADMEGCLFCVGDQPLCTEKSMRRLLMAFDKSPQSICRLFSAQRPGNPVLFPAALFPELERLPAGKGGSWLVAHHPERLLPIEADDPAELEDVDTHAALAALERRAKKRN